MIFLLRILNVRKVTLINESRNFNQFSIIFW